MDYTSRINDYINLEIETLKKLDQEKISELMNLLSDALEQERMIYIFGNGGSAATASHIQNDFNKGLSEWTEKKFRFYCLSDNIATLTAIANDISYDEIFRFQLKGRLTDKDLVFAISGSGNSKNVINAVEYAKETGAKVIGLTGYDGGKLAQLSDVNVHVPVMSMQVTEDIHMVLDHLIMGIFYETMCGKNHLRDKTC